MSLNTGISLGLFIVHLLPRKKLAPVEKIFYQKQMGITGDIFAH